MGTEAFVAKIKGTAILNVVKPLRKRRQAAQAVLPAKLHDYLRDRIMASLWYPEEDHLELVRALVKILPSDGGDIYEYMGRESGGKDLRGIYRTMIQKGNPAATLKRCALYWPAYHDTGRLLVTVEGPGRGRIDLTGYETPSPEMCGMLKGWYLEALLLAGASGVSLEHTRCVARRDPFCRFEVRWEPRDKGGTRL